MNPRGRLLGCALSPPKIRWQNAVEVGGEKSALEVLDKFVRSEGVHESRQGLKEFRRAFAEVLDQRLGFGIEVAEGLGDGAVNGDAPGGDGVRLDHPRHRGLDDAVGGADALKVGELRARGGLVRRASTGSMRCAIRLSASAPMRGLAWKSAHRLWGTVW